MAGTLTISTLSDGTNSTSATNCIQGSAKAWVNFDPSSGSSCTIRASYNVSSVSYNATGSYTVNFTTSFANTNYVAVGTSSVKIGISATTFCPNWTPPGTETASATGSFKCGVVRSDTTGAVDPVYVYISFFNS
jgi:hypothetical protein